MAEVLKKKTEDKYNTTSIKKSLEKKEKNKKAKSYKSEKKSSEKKGLFAGIRNYFSGVAVEFKRVHWPNKKDMVKYSIATVFFIIFFSLFFYAIDIIFAAVMELFK